MQCTANLRNNGEIDHIKLNWSKDNLLTRWSELTGVDPPSFSSRKCYIYTCIHSPTNMRRAAAASHLWGPRPRRCRPGRHCRWSSAPGTGCSRPASPCRGGQYYHQLSQLESVASARTMPPTQWKLPISIEELMEKKTIVLSAYVLCRISWQMRRLEKYFAKHIHHSQLPIFSTGTSSTK